MDFEFNWVGLLLAVATIVFLFRINTSMQGDKQAEKDERMFRPQPFKNSKPADNVPKSTIGRSTPSYRSKSRSRSTVHDNDYDCRPTGIFGGDDSSSGGGGDCGGGE